MAVVLLGLLAFGVFRGVATLSEDAAGKGSDRSIPMASSSSSSTPVSAGSAAPRIIMSSTTTESERSGPPSAANPVRLLVVGDSNAGTFGPYLKTLVEESGVVDVTLDYVASTGLSRPDVHDWPERLRESLTENDPEIVVVTFGGNDAQGMTAPCANGEGTCDLDVVVPQANEANAAEWRAEYSTRVAEIIDIALAGAHRRVIWVGIPNAVDPEFTERLRIQDEAVRAALAKYDDRVTFVDTWDRFDGRNGNIAELIVDPRDGVAKPVRQSDGFHLNEAGAEILAVDINEQVRQILAGYVSDG